jgi:hypothetical protein
MSLKRAYFYRIVPIEPIERPIESFRQSPAMRRSDRLTY